METEQFDSSVTRFYAGKTVLITGATGCVGKVVLEKLLHSCRNVQRIYIIVREKKGVQPADRLEAFIRSPVFAGPNRIPHNVLRDKIVPICGDLTIPGLGLSDQDRQVLQKVDIVLHCAAGVRFDDPLKQALKINFLGTRSLVLLANEMSKLEALVYVSTCYSNCQLLGELEEKVYPTKITGEQLFELSKWLHSDDLDKLAKEKFYEGRHNSYVFTKALAENYVHDHARCPTAIARLSIVLPSLEEPEPGFCDTAGAANFVAITQGLGALRTGQYQADVRPDGLPADIVARALLVLAMEMSKSKPSKPIVFNVCAGRYATLKMKTIVQMSDEIAQELVSFKTFRPCIKLLRPHSKLEYLYKKYVHELFFALVFDIILMVAAKRAFAMEKMIFVRKVRDALVPFGRRSFHFKNQNFLELATKMDKSDAELFNIDIERFFVEWCTYDNYKAYAISGCLSFMKYKLDDVPSPENVAARRRHMRMLKTREPICQVAIHGLLIALIYGVYASLSFSYNVFASI